jgi:predicted phosphodiesterase
MSENGDYYVVAFSDVHIGHWAGNRNKRAFVDFVDGFLENAVRIDHLIILGDFLDLWRRDDDELLTDNRELLQKLVRLKRDGKIGKLQYVVGNHDYLIPWYKWKGYALRTNSRRRRTLLNEFEFTEASSEKPKSLILPERGDRVNTAHTFEFKHGHQDGPGQLGAVYDELCEWLCHQGNTSGLITSVIWKYRTYLPALASLIFLGLAAWQFFLGNILWSVGFAIASAVSILLSLWMMRSEELKLKKLPEETRKKIKIQQTEVGVRDRGDYEEELWKLFPEKQRTKIFKRLEEIKIRSAPLVRNKNLVVGHTHIPDVGPPTWNLGSWIEGNDYPYLTIDRNGNLNLLRWAYHGPP